MNLLEIARQRTIMQKFNVPIYAWFLISVYDASDSDNFSILTTQ